MVGIPTLHCTHAFAQGRRLYRFTSGPALFPYSCGEKGGTRRTLQELFLQTGIPAPPLLCNHQYNDCVSILVNVYCLAKLPVCSCVSPIYNSIQRFCLWVAGQYYGFEWKWRISAPAYVLLDHLPWKLWVQAEFHSTTCISGLWKPL